MSKRETMLRVTVAYAVAIAVGGAWLWLGPQTESLVLDALIADVLATVVIFIASRIHHSSSFYDAYWSVIPPLIMFWWWSQAPADADQTRLLLVAIVMMLWAIRLTANWVYSFPGLPHEDWRYQPLRDKAPKLELLIDFFAIHLIPTGQVFLGLLPVYVVSRSSRELGWLDFLAFAVGLGAVLLELVADTQMHRFVRTRTPGQVMDQGVWSWSRHPNYFGEFSFWLALGLFGLAAAPGDWWWVLLGSLAMLAMFQGVSIPLMEERSLARRPAYAEVVARTARFVPRPPRPAT